MATIIHASAVPAFGDFGYGCGDQRVSPFLSNICAEVFRIESGWRPMKDRMGRDNLADRPTAASAT